MGTATVSGAQSARAIRGRTIARSVWTPTVVHYVALGLSFVLILILGRTQWFFGDDWAILVPHNDANIFVPHVGHWTLTPAVVFQLMRDWLGLGSYLPFLLLAVLAHLAVAHLVWRILGRVGVDRWLATLLSILVMLFGGGSENIFWAFQFGFMGAIALGLWLVVLFDRATLNIPLLVVVSVIAPTFSGTAIPVIAAAAIVGLVRHGWRKTLLVLLPTAVSYASWYLIVARHYPDPPAGITSLRDLAVAAVFAAVMFCAGIGRALPWIVLGIVPVLTTATWFFATVRRGIKSISTPAYAMVFGSIVFVILTTYARMSFGISGAAAERYAYLTLVLLLPALALQMQYLIGRWRKSFVPTIAVLGVLVVLNTVDLGIEAQAQATIETASEHRVDARLDALIAHPDDPALLNTPPDGKWSPDLLGSDLLKLYRDGEFPRP